MADIAHAHLGVVSVDGESGLRRRKQRQGNQLGQQLVARRLCQGHEREVGYEEGKRPAARSCTGERKGAFGKYHTTYV